MNLETKLKAKYIGPEDARFEPEKEYNIKMLHFKNTPAIDIFIEESNTSINYPSKKKFYSHWSAIEKETKVLNMPTNRKRIKEKELTIADAGAIIYTEVVAAVNRFNQRSKVTYKDNPSATPEFSITLQQQVYPENIQSSKKLYGAGVLIMEIKQYGLKRIVYQDGVSFKTERELKNVNAYAPKLYMKFLDSIVESALLYVIALNPDAPIEEKPKNEKKKKSSNSK